MPKPDDATTTAEQASTTLKRKRTYVRGNITRFSTEITNFNDDTKLEDVEYTCNRLTNALNDMKTLDDQLHSFLDDEQYEEDIKQCDTYIETAEVALFKARKMIKHKISPITNNTVAVTVNSESVLPPTQPVVPNVVTQTYTVKLPTIRLEPFTGDVEQWQNFWEQFQSSIDANPNLSTIDKHVFLRGYLQDEPKRLVDGISIVAATYETTKKLLTDKYGDKNRIIQAHLDFLENLPPARNSSSTALNDTYIECNRRVQALRALGEDIDSYGRVLAPKLLRAFPDDICKQWIIHAQRQKIAESNLTKMMDFISEEVQGALTTSKIKGDVSVHFNQTTAFNVQTKVTSTNKKKTHNPFCAFCETSGHWAQNCNTITDYDTRIQKLKSSNRCFLCTNRGHRLSNCPRKHIARCTKCKKQHHVSICPPTPTTVSTNSDVFQIDTPNSRFTHLQTARVYVTGPTGLTKLTRCILDAGSQTSFVNANLIDELKLKVVSSGQLHVHAFESTTTSRDTRRYVQLSVSNLWNKNCASITAFESSNQYATHPAAPVDVTHFARSRKLTLADPPGNDNLPIELLIGGDFYWHVVTSESPIKVTDSLAIVPSIFGWVLNGSRTHTTIAQASSVHHVSVQIPCDCLDDQVRCLWELDHIGIKDTQLRNKTVRENEIMQEFHDTYQTEGNRRVVSLPRKPTASLLSTNMATAEKRLVSLQKRLASDDAMKKEYDKCMLDYISQGQVEVCKPSSEDLVFYLPHHAVKKVTLTETKWRIVFDASSHEPGLPSLNDTLEIGPNLLPETVGCLLRLRLHKFAITGDGKQAFLQLSLNKKDRDSTRFLWFKLSDDSTFTDEIITYRFTRLPFGLACSPFLLCATVRELAWNHMQDFPTAAPLIDKHLYMDDFVASVETESEIATLHREVKELMKLIEIPMGKWATNSTMLQNQLRDQDEGFKTTVKVLGIEWNTENDTLGNTFTTSLCAVQNKPLTKRWLLHCIASFYDPLGLFSPFTIFGKILFQDTWILGIKWDEILPSSLATSWHTALKELDDICSLKIPRHIGISSLTSFTIHVFCDASERAYGAVLYIVSSQEDQVNAHLVCSRNRLAPIKKVTLPRLELLAALMGSRLLLYFCGETNISTTNATLWSDSQVALGWIRSDPNKWKTFVCNRVTEIVSHTNPSQWRHCPGKDNPADILSRGASPSTLKDLEIWWHGPKWLTTPEENWPDSNNTYEDYTHNLESKQKEVQTLHIASTQPIINAENYSSYFKLLRVTSWIFRFIHNCKTQDKMVGELNATELNQARNYWIQTVQKESFPLEYEALSNSKSLPKNSKLEKFNPIFDDKLIRLGGRLQFSDLSESEKHPILLEGSHPFTGLLIRQTHLRLHHLGVRIVLSHLRSEFWILRARQAIKKVIHTCLPCKILKQKCGEQIEAPLPAERIQKSTPFETTGIDFAGPLHVKNNKLVTKAYIVMFTCAITRAIHLEVVCNLSTDDFLLALQRFVSRRSLPHTVYTDNATTFCAADRELKSLWNIISSSKVHQFYAHHNVKWKFIAPRAAWWGGWWERMIGTVKQCLRKTLGKACLDTTGLTTVLCDIEAAVNSRPIVHEYGLTDDPEEALTPSHFLIGKRITTIPTGPSNSDSHLTRIWRSRQQLMDSFWKRWQGEYLMDLRSFHHVRNPPKGPEIRVGDVALLQEDIRPRHTWKKARVEAVILGRDNKVRTCTLRTNGKTISRPVQLVIPLEVDQGGEDVARTDATRAPQDI